MDKRFHFNPNTGKVGRCSARISCRFIDSEGNKPTHYISAKEASRAFEETQSTFNINKNRSKNFINDLLVNDLDQINKIPHWFKKLNKEFKNNNSDIKILGKFLVNGKEVIVTHTPKSIASNDQIVIDSGANLEKYKFYDEKSGVQIGYLKLNSVTDSSLEKSFGEPDDYLTALRYKTRFSGSFHALRNYENKDQKYKFFSSKMTEEKEKTLRKLWKEVEIDCKRNKVTLPSKKESKEKLSVNNDSSFINFEDVEKDLKFYSQIIQKEIDNKKELGKHPFVDYSSIEEEFKGKGLGSALYIIAAKDLAKRGKVIRSSGLQSEDAQNLWARFKKNGLPVGNIKLKTINPYLDQTEFEIENFTLDFRK